MSHLERSTDQSADVLVQWVPEARENVRVVAETIVGLSGTPGFERVRPLYEYVSYLNHLDYELKVLMDQLLRGPDNRAIWLKYLALVLHEALKDVSVLGRNVVKHFGKRTKGRLLTHRSLPSTR